MNELIFILHTTLIALAALGAAYLGKQALTVFVSLTFVMANILVTKQIDLFGFNVTGTDAFITGSVLALNLLNEYCGKQAAQRALTTALYSSLFVGMLATLHLWYIPNKYDTMHEHFALIFAATPRIIAASLISYFISSSFENYLYSKLKAYYEGHYVVARNFAT
ncbi:MAG: queuosine precursor transporter, partial [Candidatus Babeliales bacterium]